MYLNSTTLISMIVEDLEVVEFLDDNEIVEPVNSQRSDSININR